MVQLLLFFVLLGLLYGTPYEDITCRFNSVAVFNVDMRIEHLAEIIVMENDPMDVNVKFFIGSLFDCCCEFRALVP